MTQTIKGVTQDTWIDEKEVEKIIDRLTKVRGQSVHIAVSTDNECFKLYINGEEVAKNNKYRLFEIDNKFSSVTYNEPMEKNDDAKDNDNDAG